MNNNKKKLNRLMLGISLGFSALSSSAGVVTPFDPLTLSPGIVVDTVSATDPINNTISVSGRISPLNDITTMDVNGYSANIIHSTNQFGAPLQSFTLSLPVDDAYQFNLYNDNGSSFVVNYVAPQSPVDSAIQVVVGEQLLDDAGPMLATLLSDLDIASSLGLGPETCALEINRFNACDFILKKFQLKGEPDIKLFFTPTQGNELTINVDVAIPQVVIKTKVKRLFWWGYRNTNVYANDVRASFQIGVKPSGNQSIRLILDEPSDINIKVGSLNVSSNTIAAHLLPLFSDAIIAIVNSQVVNVTGPLLAKLEIPAIPITLPLDIDGDDQTDAEFAIKMGVDNLDVLGNDGLAVLGGSIAIPDNAIAEGRTTLGYRQTGGLLPTPEPVEAPVDLSTSIKVDFVNQLMLALYQSGLEEHITLPLSATDLGLIGLSFQALNYPADAMVNLGLSFGGQPEILVNSDSQYPLGLQLLLPMLRITMSIPAEDGSGDVLLLDFTGDALMTTSLGATPDGQLQIEFNELLAMNIPAINGGELLTLFSNPSQLQFMIQDQLPAMIDQFEPMIEELANAARLELDVGTMLADLLKTDFPSVPVSAYISETGVSDDNGYMNIGIGIDF